MVSDYSNFKRTFYRECRSPYNSYAFSSFLPSLFIPVVTTEDNITKLSFVIPLVFIPGILLSYYASGSVALVLGTIVFGLSSGATFSMALMLASVYGKSGEGSAYIMAFGQSVAYVLASFGPIVFGRLYDVSQSWRGAIISLAVISLFMAVITLFIYRNEREV